MLSPVKALLDANVLYSNHLRNLLLQLAKNDVFDARWSELIEQDGSETWSRRRARE